jgi:hypothetical protein
MSQIIITSPASGGTSTKYYGAFSSLANQFQTVISNNLPILFDTTDLSNGISLSNPNEVLFANDGIYNMTFSIQFVNTNVSIHDVNVFFKKNGNIVPNSNSVLSIPNSHGGSDGHTILCVNFMFEMLAGETLGLWWNVDNIAVSIQTIPLNPIPLAGFTPASPSVIWTIQQI